MKKRAYISVFKKDTILSLAKKLVENNWEIVATGSTCKYLNDNGINAINSSTITGFEELLGGRVKSLHPDIFASILARENEFSTLNNPPFSLVAVDLYPFEDYINKNVDIETLIENIDIGGVSILRAGAKNYQNVIVLSDFNDYDLDFENITDEIREKLAIKAIEKTAKYDFIISKTLKNNLLKDDKNSFEGLVLDKKCDLRYGENPHQKAGLYSNSLENFIDYEVLGGKELSYNNILDATAAINISSEFFDCACITIIKHTTPCGVALAPTINEAWDKALDSDPISAFGGIVCSTKEIDLELAKKLTSMFLEVVIAPSYSSQAIEELRTKKNLRVIKINTPYKNIKALNYKEFKQTPFGVLVQEADSLDLNPETFKVVTKAKPTAEQVEDMIFAFKVCKYVKSNAIVVAKDLRTLGICGGQTNRVGAMEIAIKNVCDSPKDAVIASDGFLPAVDNVEVAAMNRISAIIQPGGSIKDADVVSLADKYGLCIINTGIRHFKH